MVVVVRGLAIFLNEICAYKGFVKMLLQTVLSCGFLIMSQYVQVNVCLQLQFFPGCVKHFILIG